MGGKQHGGELVSAIHDVFEFSGSDVTMGSALVVVVRGINFRVSCKGQSGSLGVGFAAAWRRMSLEHSGVCECDGRVEEREGRGS